MDPKSVKFTWRIDNFTRMNTKENYSEVFTVGGYKWRILIFSKGNNVDHLSLYLAVADSTSLPYGWSRYAQFSLCVVNQIYGRYLLKKETQHQFNAQNSDWGFTSFMPLRDLYDTKRGYLVNDTVIVEVVVGKPESVPSQGIQLKKDASVLRQPKRGFLKNDTINVEVGVVVHNPKNVHSQGGKLKKAARIGENKTTDAVLEPNIAAKRDEQDQEIAKTYGTLPDCVHSQGESEKHASSVADQSDARIGNNGTKDPVLEPNIYAISDKQEGKMVKTEGTDDILGAGQQMINDLSGTSSKDRSAINQDKVDDKCTDTCFDVMATTLLEMLEDDKDPYSLRLHDFNDISANKYVDVGIFTVPESLESYAKDILARHADIGTGNSPVHYMNEMAFVVLRCALKSMDTTRSSEITKSLILKWRDAIRGSLQFGFKVDFLKDHLKSVTQAYLAKLVKDSHESKELQAIDVDISAKRKQLDSLTAQRADMYEKMNSKLRKTCETAAVKFSGETYGY